MSDATLPNAWGQLALSTLKAGWFALLAIAASFVLPFDGFGFDVCAVHRMTGLPCPGCGLTRAFISLAHGDLVTALGSNPFSVLLFPLFVLLSAFVLLPSGMRGRVEGWLSLRANQVGALYRVGLLAFIGFGAARFAWFFFSGERFP